MPCCPVLHCLSVFACRLGLSSSPQQASRLSGLGSYTSQGACTAMQSQPSVAPSQRSYNSQQPALQQSQTHAQQQSQWQQQIVASPGPRFTSTPTLASQREQPDFSEVHVSHASGTQAVAELQSSNGGWGVTTQGMPSQTSYNSQGIPSQGSYNSQGIPIQSSNINQGLPKQSSGSNQVQLSAALSPLQGIPRQSNLPFQDSSRPQQLSSGDQRAIPEAGLSAADTRTLRFSSAPLLGPSTSSTSQQAQHAGTSPGAWQNEGPSMSNAAPQSQGTAMYAGSSTGMDAEQAVPLLGTTQNSEAGPVSTPQVQLNCSARVRLGCGLLRAREAGALTVTNMHKLKLH